MAKLSKKKLAVLMQRTFTGQLATVKEFKNQQQLKFQQNEDSCSY